MFPRSTLRKLPSITTTTPQLIPHRRTLFGFGWLTGNGNNKNTNEETSAQAGREDGIDSVNKEVGDRTTTSSSHPTSTLASIHTASTSSSHRPPTTPHPTHPTSPTSTSTPTSQPTPPHPPQPTTEESERAAIRALLDRDGGALGFEYEDGKPEGGQRRAVKREMFRVI